MTKTIKKEKKGEWIIIVLTDNKKKETKVPENIIYNRVLGVKLDLTAYRRCIYYRGNGKCELESACQLPTCCCFCPRVNECDMVCPDLRVLD